jgi:hypothetical protein
LTDVVHIQNAEQEISGGDRFSVVMDVAVTFQLAVCSAGPRAGTKFSIQSAPISEQGCRGVPSGSRGCLVCEGFVDHSCSQGMIFLSHSFQRHRYQR